jgi:ABC-type multidrug transport system fused ATPase/permease subunit
MRVATFVAVFGLVDFVVGGVWGIVLGFFVGFSATAFLNSHLAERSSKAATVQSALAEGSADSEMTRAHTALNQARLAFVLMFAWIFLPMFMRVGQYLTIWWIGYFLIFVFLHIALGRAAVLAGRSWVAYALGPLLLPILGALVSFGVLRSKVPYAEA